MDILDKIRETILVQKRAISEHDAYELLMLNSQADVTRLLELAGEVNKIAHEGEVYTCSIVNAKSGKCGEDCRFCAQSVHYNTDVTEYSLLAKEKIYQNALDYASKGATQFSIVTSGRSITSAEMQSLKEMLLKLKRETNLNLCGSLGILTKELAEMIVECGITRYHHNLETAKSYFANICTTHSYEESLETIRIAQQAGLNVCSGGIIGMGESWEQRVELALYLRDLDVDSIPLNFLNPISGTPLEFQPILESEDALKTIAIFRLINPGKNISVAGGREITFKNQQDEILTSGANGIMIGNYLTTSGRDVKEDQVMIERLGLNYVKI